jgi:hypothetical protein
MVLKHLSDSSGVACNSNIIPQSWTIVVAWVWFLELFRCKNALLRLGQISAQFCAYLSQKQKITPRLAICSVNSK